MEVSYISGNENPKKLLIFQEVTFRAQKKKPLKKVIFQEIELSSPKLKGYLHCRTITCKNVLSKAEVKNFLIS